MRLRRAALGAVLVFTGSACSGSGGRDEPTALVRADSTTSSTAAPAPTSPSTATTLEASTTTAARPAAPAPRTPATKKPAASSPAQTATSATTRATAPTTTATATSTSGPATAASPRPAGRNEVPQAVVTELSSGQDVNLRTLIPAERPILFWFYSPY